MKGNWINHVMGSFKVYICCKWYPIACVQNLIDKGIQSISWMVNEYTRFPYCCSFWYFCASISNNFPWTNPRIGIMSNQFQLFFRGYTLYTCIVLFTPAIRFLFSMNWVEIVTSPVAHSINMIWLKGTLIINIEITFVHINFFIH